MTHWQRGLESQIVAGFRLIDFLHLPMRKNQRGEPFSATKILDLAPSGNL
jgi:hypothetical protein